MLGAQGVGMLEAAVIPDVAGIGGGGGTIAPWGCEPLPMPLSNTGGCIGAVINGCGYGIIMGIIGGTGTWGSCPLPYPF